MAALLTNSWGKSTPSNSVKAALIAGVNPLVVTTSGSGLWAVRVPHPHLLQNPRREPHQRLHGLPHPWARLHQLPKD